MDGLHYDQIGIEKLNHVLILFSKTDNHTKGGAIS